MRADTSFAAEAIRSSLAARSTPPPMITVTALAFSTIMPASVAE